MGWPIVIGPFPARTLPQEDQTVVSVGPYIFHKVPPPSTSRSPRSRGKASPPHNILNPGRERKPASSISRHEAGVPCRIVAPDQSMEASTRFLSETTSPCAI